MNFVSVDKRTRCLCYVWFNSSCYHPPFAAREGGNPRDKPAPFGPVVGNVFKLSYPSIQSVFNIGEMSTQYSI